VHLGRGATPPAAKLFKRVTALEGEVDYVKQDFLLNTQQVQGVTSHADLTGLAGDDHTQYLLAAASRDVAGDLVPDADGTRDLGASGAEYAEAWARTLKTASADITLDPGSGLVDVDGRVDSEVFGCSVRKGQTQTIATATNTALLWRTGTDGSDVEDFDSGFHTDNPSSDAERSRVTVPAGEGGIYLVTAAVTWEANNSGYRLIAIRDSGGSWIARSLVSADSGNQIAQHVSIAWALSAADYVEVLCQQDSGGDLDVQIENSYLQVIKLGVSAA